MSLQCGSPTTLCPWCNRQFFAYTSIKPPFSTEQLRSNYPPTQEQIRTVSSLTEVAQTHLERYDEEIDRLESLLDKLKEERNQLQKDIDDCRSLLAPMRSLPEDVLREVFYFCWCSPSAEDFVSETFSAISGDHALIRGPGIGLSQVCTFWRALALSTPALWSRFSFDMAFLTEGVESEILSHLERSTGYPLSFQILDTLYHNSGPTTPRRSDEQKTVMLRLLTRIFAESSRWKRVCLSLAWTELDFAMLLDSLRTADASSSYFPLLESLQLFYFSAIIVPPDERQRFLATFQTATGLRAISLPQSLDDLLKLPYSQLQNLVLSNVSVLEDVFRLLHFCPNLTKCFLGIPQSPFAVFSSESPVTLPHLQSLTISSTSLLTSLLAIFSRLVSPELSSLTVQSHTKEYGVCAWPHTAFQTFLNRSACTLQSLSIDYIRMESRDIVRIIRRLPDLTDLRISEDDSSPTSRPGLISSELLTLLTPCLNRDGPNDGFDGVDELPFGMLPSVDADAPLLRRLKTLTFIMRSAVIENPTLVEQFLEMIELRCPSDELLEEDIEALESFTLLMPFHATYKHCWGTAPRYVPVELDQNAVDRLKAINTAGVKIVYNGNPL
ncbi:hypothetical protein D9758_006350 [Tetrapyrgos nigripes]|uniref:F-box domain-containing protein n=1 Tax=Tetrapyrgos nigripes TaxID=182062 RepID=A0A8H5DA66_9AGAR|nr:hypothetical protein D9758_006350 [Tetrapyrgos nigripes]